MNATPRQESIQEMHTTNQISSLIIINIAALSVIQQWTLLGIYFSVNVAEPKVRAYQVVNELFFWKKTDELNYLYRYSPWTKSGVNKIKSFFKKSRFFCYGVNPIKHICKTVTNEDYVYADWICNVFLSIVKKKNTMTLKVEM